MVICPICCGVRHGDLSWGGYVSHLRILRVIYSPSSLQDEKGDISSLAYHSTTPFGCHIFPRWWGDRGTNSTYNINTKLRLSMVIRYFAGGCPLDIMQTHGVSLTSVYASVWGVVDAINSTSELGYPFPSHERQREIAKGFHSLSRAGFDKVIGALDGIVIWCSCKTTAVNTLSSGILWHSSRVKGRLITSSFVATLRLLSVACFISARFRFRSCSITLLLLTGSYQTCSLLRSFWMDQW